MNEKLFFTLLTFIATTSTLQTWASYEPWGWAGPSDRQIEQYRTYHAEKKAGQECKEQTNNNTLLDLIGIIILENAIISQDNPELENDDDHISETVKTYYTEQFLGNFIADTAAKKDPSSNHEMKPAFKQKDDADYCIIS